MSVVFQHGALRLYLLSLLAERPMHGYEVMQSLEQRFGGTYTPSAGTIYPRLAKLESEGFVTKEVDGRKSTYSITDAGRQLLAERQGELDSLQTEVSDSVRRLADEVRGVIDAAMRSLRAELAAAGAGFSHSASPGAGASPDDDAPADAEAGAAHAESVPNPASVAPPSDTTAGPPSGARGETADADRAAGRRAALGELELELASFRRDIRKLARADVGFDGAAVRGIRDELAATLERLRRG